MKRLPLSALSDFCATAVFIWMVVFNIRPIQDPDVWWHLASGRYMVTNQVIPKTDVFSLNRSRKRLRIDPSGCREIVAYSVARIAGLAGIISSQQCFSRFPGSFIRLLGTG